MIVFVRGTVYSLSAGYTDLDVQGVGYRVFATERDLVTLSTGLDVLFYTHHHLREEDESLYGFLAEADKRWFELLLNVSGVGPKVALQVISAARFPDFASAIAGEDSGALAKLPGIGKKTAERLILELRDKLGVVANYAGRGTGGLGGGGLQAQSAGRIAAFALSPLAADVVEALVALGYNERQAMDAVVGSSLDDAELSLEQAIKRCLSYFDTSRANRRSVPNS